MYDLYTMWKKSDELGNKKRLLDENTQKLKELIKQKEELENSGVIKKYFELNEKIDLLKWKERSIKEIIYMDSFKNCNHVFATTKFGSYGCIKCGLDFEKESSLYIARSIETEEDIKNFTMHMFLEDYDRYLSSDQIENEIISKSKKIDCDYSLAHSIFQDNCDLSDEELIKLIKEKSNEKQLIKK